MQTGAIFKYKDIPLTKPFQRLAQGGIHKRKSLKALLYKFVGDDLTQLVFRGQVELLNFKSLLERSGLDLDKISIVPMEKSDVALWMLFAANYPHRFKRLIITQKGVLPKTWFSLRPWRKTTF